MTEHTAALGELLSAARADQSGNWREVRIRGISTDSRRVRPGDLFFGLPGVVDEGARYAEDALRKGAAAVVLPPGATLPEGGVGLRHPDPFGALALAARLFYRDPAAQLKLVGVTGTNGKTTTALLTAHLLATSGQQVSFWTTTFVRLPSHGFRPQWTTPLAHELQRFLRAAVDQGSRTAVIEVSSHAVVQQRIAGLAFALGIATNFSSDHLDFHGSVEHYYQAKRSFIEGLGPGATALLNADDPRILAMGEKASASIFTYGWASAADVGVRYVSGGGGALTGVLEVRNKDLGGRASYPFRLPMVGRHNALNAAAAFAAAVRFGVEPAHAAQALALFKPPPRRLERHQVGPYVIYNDVAMNEASYDAVLRTLADASLDQIIVVHALRGNRGAEVNARIADIFARWDRTLRFSPLIVSESRSDLGGGDVDHEVRPAEREAFANAADKARLPTSFHVELDAALGEAVDRLTPGGVLLLLGTFGMDRGPAKARAMLQRRLGLRVEEGQDYLAPLEEGF
ncbi:MAG: Mur ligase family protein [Thermaerobacter sp.]|nr:Mur ligase family protein [Thermaerobacter sp.]